MVSIALKPTSSIACPGRTIDVQGASVEVVTTGRHDPCVGLRATPIAEAMLALVLMDHYLRHRGAERGRRRKRPIPPRAYTSWMRTSRAVQPKDTYRRGFMYCSLSR